MNIYRVKCRAEAFKNCGLLFATPIVHNSLTEVRKLVNKELQRLEKAGLNYYFRLHRLEVKTPTVKDMIATLKHEDPDYLIESETWMQSWNSEE